jgi:hypothetical protein
MIIIMISSFLTFKINTDIIYLVPKEKGEVILSVRN